MTKHKTMNTVAHAAFRRDLSRFDAALGEFPGGSQHRADELTRAWDHFAAEIHHHHDYEEQFFWPALEQLVPQPSLLTDLGGQHDEMRRALTTADETMRALGADPSAAHAADARAAVAHLSDVLLAHLDDEERQLEPLSAEHASSPAMRAATKQVIKAHRGRLGNVLAWMQDGADDDARRFIRSEIPAPVVIVATAVGGRQYRRTIAPVWAGTRS